MNPLIWLPLTPLLVALTLPLCSRWPNLREGITLLGGLGLFLLSLTQYLSAEIPSELILTTPLPGYPLLFRPEPLGIAFSLLVSFLWPITSLYAVGYMRGHKEKNQTRFYVFFALSIAVTQAIALSGNMLTLFLFYELLTLMTYPLVTHSGSEAAKKAGRTYLGILMSTSIMFLLLATVWSAQLAGTLEFTPGGIFPDTLTSLTLNTLLLLFVFGTAKAALMPFHGWLPQAMVAPVPVSALLHAVAVVKAGVFTLLKVVIYLFGSDLVAGLSAAEFVAYLAGFTLVTASLIALRKDNIKARLAYSTIGQLSYIILGTMIATHSSVIGSSMHMVTHAFGKITLFFCAGAILLATHKTKVSELDGCGKQIPVTIGLFTLAALSTIGLPPFAGMWSKWWLLQGTVETEHYLLTAALLLSSILNLAYLMEIPLRAFLKPAQTATPVYQEAPLLNRTAATVTTALCIILFLLPEQLFQHFSMLGGG